MLSRQKRRVVNLVKGPLGGYIEERKPQTQPQTYPKQSVPIVQRPTTNPPPNMLSATNQTIQYFSFPLQNQIDQSDPSKCFQYNIPLLSPNQRTLILQTQQISTSLIGFSGDYVPKSISIALRNFTGFIGVDGVPTNKIITLNLSHMAMTEVNGLITKDLIYSSNLCANWNLGSLRNLVFQVYVDQEAQPVPTPFTNPISISFNVIHVTI